MTSSITEAEDLTPHRLSARSSSSSLHRSMAAVAEIDATEAESDP
jgi:hypothetical protein